MTVAQISRLSVVIVALIVVAPQAVWAQSTISPQADWNGTYGFSSNADRNFRLLQSDLIKKNDEDYYSSVGKISVTNNTNQVSSNSTTTNNTIGQQQTTIGVISNATNNVELKNSAGARVDTSNVAESAGCIDSTIHIDSQPASGASNSCN